MVFPRRRKMEYQLTCFKKLKTRREIIGSWFKIKNIYLDNNYTI